MRIPDRLTTRVLAAGLTIALSSAAVVPAAAEPASEARLEAGKRLTMARDKGNCLACHAIEDGELPGNIGPPLIQMQLRFPDRAVLRQQVWDATARNPDTVMPPFGKHGILTEEEIDLIVDYIHSL